jgi:hypothetical protein
VTGSLRAQTRRELLLGSAAGVAGTLVAAASAPAAETAADAFEIDRLQRLLRLELLLLFCYRHVLASPLLTARAHRTLAPFIAHEQAHIAALERPLRAAGGAIPSPPASVAAANRDLGHRKIGGRLGQLRGDLDAVRLLMTLEQVTIGAYFVALMKIQDTNLIELVSQIMANEAQHDAMLGLLLPPNKPANAVPYGLVQGLQ